LEVVLCGIFLFVNVFAALKPIYQSFFFFVINLFLGEHPFWKSKKLCKQSLDEVDVVKQRSCPLWLDPASSVLIGIEWEHMWILRYKKKS